MAQFPVADKSGIIDAINYVLSGPTSLGDSFAYFNSNGLEQWDLTGNYRLPFSQISYNDPHVPGINLYVAPIALSTSEMLDGFTWKFTFATPQTTAPFINGQPIYVTGVADSWYNDSYGPIGVADCTTTYVIAKSKRAYAIHSPSTGGTVELNSMDSALSTDCNGRVTVNSATELVSISNQINFEVFADPAFAGSYYCQIAINRYHSETNNDPINPDYYFVFDKTIAYKEFLIPTTLAANDPNIAASFNDLVTNITDFRDYLVPVPGLTPDTQGQYDTLTNIATITADLGTLTNPVTPGVHTQELESIFTSIIDQPGPGYFWYIVELTFIDNSGGNIVTNVILKQRSFSAQVMKT